MRIGYFADGPWAHLNFQRIIKDKTLKIVFICVRYKGIDEILKKYAKEYNIDLLENKNINSDDFYEQIKNYNIDLIVSMSFDQIFGERLINFPPLKAINCHAGKLPFYRGRNILNWVLINDEKEFGITVHYIDSGIDTGDIILQKSYPITDDDDYCTLLEKSYVGCADILYQAIKEIQLGTAQRIQQVTIDKVGIYCGKRQSGDEIINWNQSSRRIFNFVRALCVPGPIARTYIGDKEVKINKVRMIAGARNYIGVPGQILCKTKDGFWIKTEDNVIEVIDYISEIKIKVGDRFQKERIR